MFLAEFITCRAQRTRKATCFKAFTNHALQRIFELPTLWDQKCIGPGRLGEAYSAPQ
jgi:hypothetical protein